MERSLAVTDGLTEAEKLELEGLLRQVTLSPGKSLLDEGQPAAGLYLVDAGRITVLKRDMGGHPQFITTLSAPALVGELEVLTGEPCAATVTAEDEVRARLLSCTDFEQLLSRGDAAALKLLRNLARALGHKLLATDEVYVDLAIWR